MIENPTVSERVAPADGGGLARYAGRKALVYGGSSGIGAAVAHRLESEGAEVLIADRQPPADGPGKWLAVDAVDAEALRRSFAEAAAELGTIDLVVNTIGITLEASVDKTSWSDWSRVLHTNLSAAFVITDAAVSGMRPHSGAAIVHVASDAGLVGWPDQAAYCASKGGLVHFVKAAALDAADRGIRVNCVCPSFTLTPLAEAWISGGDDPAKRRAEMDSVQPLGRMALPAEIAAGIAWLGSEEAAFVTGIALPIDGGVSCQ